MIGFCGLFKKFVELPLIGPDAGFEAKLLARGKKPIGLFVDKYPPAGVVEARSGILDKIRADVARLDELVVTGCLKKLVVVNNRKDGCTWTWHFYSQPEFMALMHSLSKDIVGCANMNGSGKIDHGRAFGYSETDIQLFQEGGYNSTDQPIRLLLKSTHTVRKALRLSKKLNEFPPSPEF